MQAFVFTNAGDSPRRGGDPSTTGSRASVLDCGDGAKRSHRFGVAWHEVNSVAAEVGGGERKAAIAQTPSDSIAAVPKPGGGVSAPGKSHQRLGSAMANRFLFDFRHAKRYF